MTLRCPFCAYAAKNESAVATSRLLAIHLVVSHADEFHDLAAHVSSDLDERIGKARVAERAAHQPAPDLRALLDGGPCFYCRHGDRDHHSSAFPRWCGECHCRAYAPTSDEYLHALVVLRRAALASPAPSEDEPGG